MKRIQFKNSKIGFLWGIAALMLAVPTFSFAETCSGCIAGVDLVGQFTNKTNYSCSYDASASKVDEASFFEPAANVSPLPEDHSPLKPNTTEQLIFISSSLNLLGNKSQGTLIYHCSASGFPNATLTLKFFNNSEGVWNLDGSQLNEGGASGLLALTSEKSSPDGVFYGLWTLSQTPTQLSITEPTKEPQPNNQYKLSWTINSSKSEVTVKRATIKISNDTGTVIVPDTTVNNCSGTAPVQCDYITSASPALEPDKTYDYTITAYDQYDRSIEKTGSFVTPTFSITDVTAPEKIQIAGSQVNIGWTVNIGGAGLTFSSSSLDIDGKQFTAACSGSDTVKTCNVTTTTADYPSGLTEGEHNYKITATVNAGGGPTSVSKPGTFKIGGLQAVVPPTCTGGALTCASQVQGYKAKVNWAVMAKYPVNLLKSTIKFYDGTELVDTVTRATCSGVPVDPSITCDFSNTESNPGKLKPQKTYTYTIDATDNFGKVYSLIKDKTITIGGLSFKSIPDATPNPKVKVEQLANNQFKLTWSLLVENTELKGLEVKYGTDNPPTKMDGTLTDSNNCIGKANTGTLNCDFNYLTPTGLTEEQLYNYSISATDNQGNPAVTEFGDFTPKGIVFSAVKAVQESGNKMKLSWTLTKAAAANLTDNTVTITGKAKDGSDVTCPFTFDPMSNVATKTFSCTTPQELALNTEYSITIKARDSLHTEDTQTTTKFTLQPTAISDFSYTQAGNGKVKVSMKITTPTNLSMTGLTGSIIRPSAGNLDLGSIPFTGDAASGYSVSDLTIPSSESLPASDAYQLALTPTVGGELITGLPAQAFKISDFALTVEPVNPIPDLAFQWKITVGPEIKLTNTRVTLKDTTNGATFDSGNLASGSDCINGNAICTFNKTWNNLNPGTYDYTVTAVDNFGDTKTESKQIIIQEPLKMSYEGPIPYHSGVEGQAVYLTITSGGQPYTNVDITGVCNPTPKLLSLNDGLLWVIENPIPAGGTQCVFKAVDRADSQRTVETPPINVNGG